MQDRDEHTLELSLFAEAFQEMLARHFGSRILKALYIERQGFLMSISPVSAVRKAIIDHCGLHRTVQGSDLPCRTVVCAESISSLCRSSDKCMDGGYRLKGVRCQWEVPGCHQLVIAMQGRSSPPPQRPEAEA